MKSRILLTAAAVMLAAYSTGAYAKTQVQWWHAMGGELGAKLEEIVKGYNASQDEYEVVPVYKGSYPETMTAAIAAFRAGEQPAIVQVFEVGTGTMTAAKGAVYPAYKLMEDAGEPFDPKGFLQAVVGYYTDTDGNMFSMPFNSSTPIVYYNKDVFKKAGLDLETSPKTWGDIEEFSKKIMTSGGCVLVGPSGCGKSTLLRMVAGLESITSGTVMIDDAVVNDREPAERDIAMVFQSCALYQHMKVYDNMAYGLRNRGMARGEIDRRVREAARILELSQLLERRPRELSGGQRRRVAMGRAIVPSPKVFLFDEPLSNLDAKLRGQMRVEIRNLQKRIGVTSVYVTHDQVEAMTLADKLVVMNNGLAEQIGTSLEIYSRPASTFVASFIGSPAMNLVEAAVDGTGVGLRIGDATMALRGVSLPASEPMIFGVRPEHLRLAAGRGDLELTVEAAEALGADTLAHQRQRQRGGNAGGAAPRRDEGGGRGRFAADL